MAYATNFEYDQRKSAFLPTMKRTDKSDYKMGSGAMHRLGNLVYYISF